MKGLTSIESKLRTLDKAANEQRRGDYVSVVRYDMITGEVDWPDSPNPSGVLLAPRPCSLDEWEALGGEWLEKN